MELAYGELQSVEKVKKGIAEEFSPSLFQKACRVLRDGVPKPPEAGSRPFRGEFPKQSGGLFWKEGHFGRKCP